MKERGNANCEAVELTETLFSILLNSSLQYYLLYGFCP